MTPELLAFHQHGWTHLNYEVEGRKCEFGVSRPKDWQYLDLMMGRKKIEELLDCVTETFTPPWNRCTEITAECLAELGFKVLSRDATAAPLNHAGLAELPVQVDWFRKRNGVRVSYLDLSKKIAAAVAQRASVGIMLHHAMMDETELVHLAQLLALLSTHSKASCLQMKALTGAQ
jgi:hypothetical protein